jgi:hypothetical protein
MGVTVTVEDLGNGLARETENGAPAVETKNARAEQIGPYRQDNVPASQSAIAQTLAGVDAVAPTEFIAARGGTIIGIVARSNADFTAGTATFQASKNGTAVGSTAVLSDTVQQKITDFETPVDFVVGDRLGVVLTSTSLAPTTADVQSYLLIRWGAV